MTERTILNVVLVVAFVILMAIGLGVGSSEKSEFAKSEASHTESGQEHTGSAARPEEMATEPATSCLEYTEPVVRHEELAAEPATSSLEYTEPVVRPKELAAEPATTALEYTEPVVRPKELAANTFVDDSETDVESDVLSAAVNKELSAGDEQAAARVLLELMIECRVQLPPDTPPSLRELLELAVSSYRLGRFDRAYRMASVALEVLDKLRLEEMEASEVSESDVAMSVPVSTKSPGRLLVPVTGEVISGLDAAKLDEEEISQLASNMSYNGFYHDGQAVVGLLRKPVGESLVTVRVKVGEEVPGIPGLEVISIKSGEIVLSGRGGRPFIRIPRRPGGGQ